MITNLEEARCPSCSADWVQMEKDLNSPLEWVEYSDGKGGFMGKSGRRMNAELLMFRCSGCAQHFREK